MALEHGAEQGLLVGEILVQSSDGDTGAVGDACGGQALLPFGEQNLNGCGENCVHCDGGAGLHGRFTRVEERGSSSSQMRTPNLKLPSSKHWKRKACKPPASAEDFSDG